MGDVKAVPAGKYGKAALESLGVWASVEDKVAQAENVRAALKLVSTGEAALGIVYETDAHAEPGVKVIGTFPEDSHPPIVYPVAPTAASKNADAPAFLKFLQSAKAKELFEAQGFTVPRADRVELRQRLQMDWLLDLTPDEWNAVRLSIKVATVAMVGEPAVRHR